jgi:hypothetical protein
MARCKSLPDLEIGRTTSRSEIEFATKNRPAETPTGKIPDRLFSLERKIAQIRLRVEIDRRMM